MPRFARKGVLLRYLAVGLALVMVSSCAVRTDEIARDPNSVRIALNGWVGYEASAAVLEHVLQEDMDYDVQLVRVDEQPSWQALDQGVLDVILENWGHDDLYELYGPEGNDTVVDGGSTGNEGVIGWYMPAYLAEEQPELLTPEGLRENTDLFRTPETGDQGEFLGGAPGFATQDEGMINAFDMDLEIVYAGSEAAQITEVQRRYANEEPVLFYSNEPHWIQEELDLVKVDFPVYFEGCDDDLEYVPCDYPAYDLNKIFREGFADNDDLAYRFLDNWTWTNADQNEVAGMIADEGMDPDLAAGVWVEQNRDKVESWLPEGYETRTR